MITDALERVLGDHLGTPIALAAEPTPISGGFWAAIHGFSIAGAADELPTEWTGRLVLRVMPNRVRAEHETIVQRAVADSGFPTPSVLLDGFDEALGGAFIVMPFADGKSPLSGLGPRQLLGLPRLFRRLPVQLAEVAVRLHSLDPAPIERALVEAGMAATGDGVELRLAAIGVAAQTDSRGFVELLDWFAAHRPGSHELVVCHGDLHPFNLLVDDDGHITVLDWTNADLMPREMDVAFTTGLMRCSPIKVPRATTRLLDRLSAWLADRFVTTYQQSTRLDPQLMTWFEALQHARCLAEVASARSGLSNIVGPDHPFEISSPAMIRRLATLTGITVSLPTRRSDTMSE